MPPNGSVTLPTAAKVAFTGPAMAARQKGQPASAKSSTETFEAPAVTASASHANAMATYT